MALEQPSFIFVAYAPMSRTKQFYLEQLNANRIITIKPDFWTCYEQMRQRTGSKGALQNEMKWWYDHYSQHPLEEVYERGTDILDTRA